MKFEADYHSLVNELNIINNSKLINGNQGIKIYNGNDLGYIQTSSDLLKSD
jgi:hypothetical protein